MNRLWRERIANAWTDRHEEIKKARKRLGELDEQAKTRALTVEEQWERAIALGETEERAAALPATEKCRVPLQPQRSTKGTNPLAKIPCASLWHADFLRQS